MRIQEILITMLYIKQHLLIFTIKKVIKKTNFNLTINSIYYNIWVYLNEVFISNKPKSDVKPAVENERRQGE